MQAQIEPLCINGYQSSGGLHDSTYVEPVLKHVPRESPSDQKLQFTLNHNKNFAYTCNRTIVSLVILQYQMRGFYPSS